MSNAKSCFQGTLKFQSTLAILSCCAWPANDQKVIAIFIYNSCFNCSGYFVFWSTQISILTWTLSSGWLIILNFWIVFVNFKTCLHSTVPEFVLAGKVRGPPHREIQTFRQPIGKLHLAYYLELRTGKNNDLGYRDRFRNTSVYKMLDFLHGFRL